MDLSEKINILYDVIYSKTVKTKYKINNIKFGNINLDDIKFKYIDSEKYNEILTQVFLGKFKLLQYNNDNYSTILKKYSDDLSLYISITPYKNHKGIDSFEDKNNNDSLFSYILSELTLNKKTRHILLPIINIDAEFQQISDILKNHESFSDYSTAIQNNEISNMFSINVKENFFKGMFLNQYLENHECKLKNLLFQVIHTLAVIQDTHTGFRHNKLNENNIYSYIKKNTNECIKYNFKKDTYYLTNNIIDIKFTNFNDASIPKYYSSKSDVPFHNKKNDYFDLHYFLNSMYNNGYLETNCKETNKFIDKILPEKYRNKTNKYYLEENVELFKPKDLLQDDYFKEYKNKPTQSENMMSDNNYYTNKQNNSNEENSDSEILVRKLKDIEIDQSDIEKLSRTLTENLSDSENFEQSGGGTITNLPVKPERNDPFLSNDKRSSYKKNKENDSDSQSDSEHNNRHKEKKFFNKPGMSKFPHNSPFNPKGYNKSFKKSKSKPSFKPKFNKEDNEKSFYKEEKLAQRTETESSDSEKKKEKNYGPFDTNQRKRNEKILNDEKPPTPKPKSPEIVAEQIVYKNPSFKPQRKFKPKEWWDPEKNEAEENRRKPFEVPQGKIHSPGPSRKSYHQYESDTDSESNTEFTEDSPQYKPRYDKPQYNKHHHDKPHYDKPHYDKPHYNKSHHDKPRYDKPHYNKSHSDSHSHPPKPKYHQDVTQTPLLAEQRVYEPAPKKGSDHRHPKYNHPGFIKLEDESQFPPEFVWDYKSMPWPRSMPLKKPNEIPLQKVYNINLGNASNKHTTLNTIYEDIIPGDPYTYSMVKISERQHLLKFIKNVVLQNNDTENLTLQSDPNVKSIQSFFRILSFNPYNNKNTNPYQNLPINFLLYNLAYPVRYDGSSVNIAKNSLGLNLRIYSLSNGATLQNATLQTTTLPPRNITWHDYDVWREMFYYEYIRDVIMKRNISPNFITLFFYGNDTISRINYNELNRIITDHNTGTYVNLQINNQNANNHLFPDATGAPQVTNDTLTRLFNSPPDRLFTQYSNKSLLTVTEAPTSSFLAWAQPTYDRFGAQFKMISTGHHTDEVWISVLFQLMYALSVMEEHNIVMRNFSLKNNIFIKDLFSNSNSVHYWLYKIDDYDFYVPNYGYLLLVDSRFVDVVDYSFILDKDDYLKEESGKKQIFKITEIGKNSNSLRYRGYITNLDASILADGTLDSFKDIVRKLIDELTTGDIVNSMSDYIKNKLTNLRTELGNSNLKLKQLLGKHFGDLLHNRIGTQLLKSERDNLSFGVTSDITPGKLVVYQERFDEYRWGVIVGEEENGKVAIMSRDNNNKPNERNEFVSNVFSYPHTLNVEQDKNNNVKLTPDGLLETYRLE